MAVAHVIYGIRIPIRNRQRALEVLRALPLERHSLTYVLDRSGRHAILGISMGEVTPEAPLSRLVTFGMEDDGRVLAAMKHLPTEVLQHAPRRLWLVIPEETHESHQLDGPELQPMP